MTADMDPVGTAWTCPGAFSSPNRQCQAHPVVSNSGTGPTKRGGSRAIARSADVRREHVVWVPDRPRSVLLLRRDRTKAELRRGASLPLPDSGQGLELPRVRP